jgi:hypothetical protein
VHLTSDLVAPCPPETVFAWVDDLARYPAWMPLVHRAMPETGSDDAWLVELRAKVGPLARSKRLRMVRAVLDAPHEVRFERAELDERRHSPWTLRASLETDRAGVGTRLTVELHYGGGLWTGGLLERTLADQIDEGKRNLLALLSAPTR